MTLQRLALALAMVVALPAQAAAEQMVVDVLRLSQLLPEATLSKVREKPKTFAAEAADVILSFGAAGAINAEGLATSVVSDRARIRAREIDRFLPADLDDEWVMTRAEVDGLIGRSAEGSRGPLRVAFLEADVNADGTVDRSELEAHALAVALARVTEDEAAERLALMAFDLDADGTVSVDELVAGVAALADLEVAAVRKAI